MQNVGRFSVEKVERINKSMVCYTGLASRGANADQRNGSYRFNATINTAKGANNCIVLYGVDWNGNPYHKAFYVGDVAEFDSFNLIYTDEIVRITEKTVEFKEGHSGREKRLNIYSFAMRNWDFDATEVAQKNADTMMHI